MKHVSVQLPGRVYASFYYKRMINGVLEAGAHRSVSGYTNLVSTTLLSQLKAGWYNLYPNTSENRRRGRAVVTTVITETPDSHPSDDIQMRAFVPNPIKGKDLRLARSKGIIMVSPLVKEKVLVSYQRGSVITNEDNLTFTSQVSNIIQSSFSKGDSITIGGYACVITSEPNIYYYYGTAQMMVDYHPFDVGWPQSFGATPQLAVNHAIVTKTLADAESGALDALTEMAELPSTLEFLKDTIRLGTQRIEDHQRTIKHYKKLLKKAKGRLAEKIARKLASAHLAFRYAIMPIVYTIEDIKKLLKDLKRTYAKFRATNSEPLNHPVPGFKQVGYATMIERSWIKRAYSPEHLVDNLLGQLKFNFFSTAWELVTLSFVVDWFLNIGDVITSFTGNKAHISQAATFSRKIEGTAVYQSESMPDVKVELSYDCYERSVIEPRDYIRLHYEANLTFIRCVDAVALALGPSIKALKRIRHYEL